MDDSQEEFREWIEKVHEWLRMEINQDPIKFKVRVKPTFMLWPIMPSNNPGTYPPELRTKLAITRSQLDVNDVTVNAQVECKGEKVDPSQVWAGSYMTPVFKLSYYKNGDDFGLNFTVLKAEYEPGPRNQISNDAWVIDSSAITDSNVSGSESE
jgi:hypothetical protein